MSRPPDAGEAPRRIAVLRPRGLGDIVLSTAVLDALRRAYPSARIDYLAEPPARPFLEIDPRLDRIFLWRGAPTGDPRFASGAFREAIGWLRAGRVDLVLDLFSNPMTAILTAMSGARRRVGWRSGIRSFVYDVRVPRFRGSAEEDRRFAIDRMLDFLRDAGVRWEGEARPSAPVTAEDRALADAALRELGYRAPGTFGAVLPGGSWESKKWTVEGYVAAGRRLAERFGVPTLVIWGPPEKDEAERIAAALGAGGRLAPPTTLRGMAALLGTPGLLVAADCLGRHLSIIQDVPTVGIFGSTDPVGWTPRTGPHGFVSGRPQDGYPSLAQLPAEPVLHEIDRVIGEWKLG